MKKARWTYRRRERFVFLKSGHQEQWISHQICFDGVVIDRSSGIDQIAGERAKTIVKECNRLGVIPDETKIAADFSPGSREKFHKES